MPEMKNTLSGVKGRLDTAEDKNCNFVDIAMEINKNETEGEKKGGVNRILIGFETTISSLIYMELESSNETEIGGKQ